mgnify:CR=1 FL=1
MRAFLCPVSPLSLQLFNGTNLVLVDAVLFAVQLFKLVEAGVVVVLGRVDGLDFAAVIQGDHGRR